MSDLGIYILGNDSEPVPVAECDDDALAFCLRTLHAEEQITCDSMVGILSLEDRVWILSPWPPTPFGRRNDAPCKTVDC